MNLLLSFCLIISSLTAFASNSVNVYAWGGEIPSQLIKAFEKRSGIKVNFNSYDSNESLYTKLRTGAAIDVILPSSYYVDRLRKKKMLQRLDPKQLPHLRNINPFFLHKAYDPDSAYSVPHLWGATGLFYHRGSVKQPPLSWGELWQARFKNQLLVLDDPRELFAIALLAIGYPANDCQPAHLALAYKKLTELLPNVKLFATNTIQSVMIDEDATVGMAWNGDALKAQAENNNIQFSYPDEGFVIWVDCFAIPQNAANLTNAYRFIDFMIKATSAKVSAEEEGFATANAKGYQLLPKALRDNPIIYPPASVLIKGTFLADLGDKGSQLINHYWQQLKLLV